MTFQKSLATALFSLLTIATATTPVTASAAEQIVLSTHAAACKPYSTPSDAALTSIGSDQSGIYNADYTTQLTRKVICPLARAAGTEGATVWVDGEASAEAAIGCIVYSHNYDGTLRASKGIVGNKKPFDNAVQFDSSEAPYWARLSMVCSLPPMMKAKLYGALVKS